MNKFLIEYAWNEVTSEATFVYLNPDLTQTTETRYQPIQCFKPDRDSYWSQLIWSLQTQGV